MSSQVTAQNQYQGDRYLDSTLRPRSFDEYMGQKKIKNNLAILIEAAKKRKEAIEHILLCGPSGLGKTSLAHIIAKEMAVNIKITSGPAIEKVGDLASILTNLEPHDVLFCDECHRLNKVVEETLYPAMEDFILDIVIGKGPSARTLQLELPPFTFIGATTRTGLLSSPLRSRFGATYRLDFYQNEDIEKIISRSADILKVKINQGNALKSIAESSRRTPRVANRLLKRVRDYSQVRGSGEIDEQAVKDTFGMLEVDHFGLEPSDRLILQTIIEKFAGGPVGLQTLAAAIQEEPETISDVHEPYLLQLGLLDRTRQGRLATKLAYEHLGLEYLLRD